MSYGRNTLAAGATWEVCDAGGFFRILAATGAVKVEFYRNGSLLAAPENVQAGLWRVGEIDRVRINDQSGASNAVEIMIDDSQVGYDRAAGSVSIVANVPSQFVGANTQKTVTTTSAQLVAALATRKYLLVQNKDATGNIYLNFGAGAATTANGLKIGPGQSYELNCNISTAAIQAIGDVASNANVIVIEG